MIDRRRAARRAILSGLAGFVLLQGALLIVLVHVAPWLRDPALGMKTHSLEQRLRAAPHDALTVVVLGSSRTAFGLDGTTASEQLSRQLGRPVVVHNFGIIGAGPCTELLSLRRLLDDGIRPDLVLIEILPYLFSGSRMPGDLLERFMPTVTLRPGEFAMIERLSQGQRQCSHVDWCLAWVVPAYHYRLRLVRCIASTLVPEADRLARLKPYDPAGWYVPEVDVKGPRDFPRVREILAPVLADFRFGGPPVEALEEMLLLCKQENLGVAMLLMPEGPHFRSWYPRALLDQVHAMLDGLARKHRVVVHDARTWMEENDFSDSHHLLRPGAVKFTQWLTERILEPTLATVPGRGFTARARPGGAAPE